MISKLPEIPIEWLSPFAQRLVPEIGRQDTLTICRTFGGRALYIPTQVTAENEIARAVGLATAWRLVLALGTGVIEVPRARSWEIMLAVLDGMRDGASNREISYRVDCGIRTVRRIRVRLQREMAATVRTGREQEARSRAG